MASGRAVKVVITPPPESAQVDRRGTASVVNALAEGFDSRQKMIEGQHTPRHQAGLRLDLSIRATLA